MRPPEPPTAALADRKPRPVIPTVRQAVEARLADGDRNGDSLTLLLLGRHLGPSQRLNVLDDPEHMASLERWFDETWGSEPGDRRTEARTSLTTALDYWRRQDWLAEPEPSAEEVP